MCLRVSFLRNPLFASTRKIYPVYYYQPKPQRLKTPVCPLTNPHAATSSPQCCCGRVFFEQLANGHIFTAETLEDLQTDTWVGKERVGNGRMEEVALGTTLLVNVPLRVQRAGCFFRGFWILKGFQNASIGKPLFAFGWNPVDFASNTKKYSHKVNVVSIVTSCFRTWAPV